MELGTTGGRGFGSHTLGRSDPPGVLDVKTPRGWSAPTTTTTLEDGGSSLRNLSPLSWGFCRCGVRRRCLCSRRSPFRLLLLSPGRAHLRPPRHRTRVRSSLRHSSAGPDWCCLVSRPDRPSQIRVNRHRGFNEKLVFSWFTARSDRRHGWTCYPTGGRLRKCRGADGRQSITRATTLNPTWS